jgi:hypothetical protein
MKSAGSNAANLPRHHIISNLNDEYNLLQNGIVNLSPRRQLLIALDVSKVIVRGSALLESIGISEGSRYSPRLF